MATLARTACSSFTQQQLSSTTAVAAASTTTARATSPSSQSSSFVGLPSGSSTSSSSCESGIILSANPLCSSLTNSLTESSCVDAASTNTVQTTTCTTTGMLSATLFATTALTPSLSAATVSVLKATSPVSMTCSALLSSTTTSTAPANSAHHPLLNGLGVSDAALTAVNSNSIPEDSRALQLALELSMVGLNNSLQSQVHKQQQQHLQQLQQQHLHHMQHHQKQLQQSKLQKSSAAFDMSTFNVAAANALNTQAPSTIASQLNQFSTTLLPGIEDRAKKSQNMTECVPVPSSEHVAEIVGRQGCKIKALRAKTNTYIKTPVRGEEPVFVVTGRKEDVAKAKREILSAAEHFSVIRASRKPSLTCNFTGNLNGSSGSCNKTPPGPPLIPGHVTIQVRVPYRVVGLVVGSKGATIKHIQQETQTYIVTPSREKEPIFDVSGLPENVQAARKQIEAHIAIRTGTAAADEGAVVGNVVGAVHTINSLSQILNDDISPEFLASIYKNGLCSTFDYSMGVQANEVTTSSLPIVAHNNCTNLNQANPGSQIMHNTISNSNHFQVSNKGEDVLNDRSSSGTLEGLNAHHGFSSGFNVNIKNGTVGDSVGSAISAINLNSNMSVSGGNNPNGMSRSCSSASSTTSSKSTNNSGGSGGSSSRPELSNIWKHLGDSLDVDEGIGESPSIWTLPGVFNKPGAHYSSSTTSISPTDSLLRESNTFGQLLAIQAQQQQRELIASGNNSNSLIAMQQQQQMILQHNHQLGMRRECLICADKEVTAALVPCGHNMFCMECAKRICASADSICPACSQSVFHAMRILP